MTFQECHKVCHLGDFREGAKKQTQFPRDEFGNYDPENGTYRDQKTLLNVKYEKEMRGCFGVAIRVGEDGCEHGVRMMPFNYTEKKIITKMESDRMMRTEIAHVKRNHHNSPKWMKNERTPGMLYFDDPVDKIEGVGVIAKKRLNENQIFTVGDLHGLNSDQELIVEIVKRTKGLTVQAIARFLENSKDLSSEDAPPTVFYCDDENPYAAKFGTEENEWGEPVWIEEIKKSQTFANTICITDMVKHMVMEAKKCYSGTAHEQTYSIYHDALSQITHDSCVKWMQETKVPGENTSVYKRFINPVHRLNDMYGSRWAGRLVGNSPEVMPLDTSLFQDVKEAVRKHVAMSLTIRKPGIKDNRLFLTSTPKEAWHAYSRVFDPLSGVAPTPKRIVQDIYRVKDAWWGIFKAEGVYVPGLAGGRIPGIRHVAIPDGSSIRRGGKRTRIDFHLDLDMRNRHVDLRHAWEEHGGDITSKFALEEDEFEDSEWDDEQ